MGLGLGLGLGLGIRVRIRVRVGVRMAGWMDGWMDGWVGGWMDGWMVDGWMDGWMDGGRMENDSNMNPVWLAPPDASIWLPPIFAAICSFHEKITHPNPNTHKSPIHRRWAVCIESDV